MEFLNQNLKLFQAIQSDRRYPNTGPFLQLPYEIRQIAFRLFAEANYREAAFAASALRSLGYFQLP